METRISFCLLDPQVHMARFCGQDWLGLQINWSLGNFLAINSTDLERREEPNLMLLELILLVQRTY